MKLYKYLVIFFIAFPCFAESTNDLACTEKFCQIKFENNSIQFSIDEIKDCLSKVPADLINSIFVVGSASPETGSVDYNQTISVKRAKFVAGELKKQLGREIPVYVQGIGANSFWQRTSNITMYLNKIPNVSETIQKGYFIYERESAFVWLGFIAVFVPNLEKFTNTPMYGFQVGMRKIVYFFNEDLFLYPALVANEAKGSRQNSDLGQEIAGEDNKGRFALSNISLLAGAEYKFTKYSSLFLEIGPAYTQRTIVLSDATDQPLGFYQYHGLAFSTNLGFNFYAHMDNKYDFFVRTAIETMYGAPQRRRVYKTSDYSASMNINAYMIIPTISLGFQF